MSAIKIGFARVCRTLRPSSMVLAVGCVALALMLSMGNTLRAFAAPGDLDTTFGGDGLVTTDFAGDTENAEGVAIQSDGKIVAAGQAVPGSTAGDFAVARYNSNGTLDDNFAANGKVTTDFFGNGDAGRAVAIQPDGKIVVGGYATNSSQTNFAVVRYNPDGSLDTSFSGNGKVYIDFGTTSAINGVAIQSDGKIVMAGYVVQASNMDDFAVARLNSNGSLDTSFSGDGKAMIDFGARDAANAVAIQANGKIVAAGATGVGGASDFALARLNTGGGLDTTFSFDGKVTTDFFGNNDYINDVAIQQDGNIVAAGTAQQSSTVSDFGLARYTSDGTLDTSFSGNGKVTTDFGGNENVLGLAIQQNGKIVAAGNRYYAGDDDFALARYDVGGALDTSFGGDGKVTTDFSGQYDFVYSLALQSNGKIVVAGQTYSGTQGYFGLARYLGDTPAPPTGTPTNVPPTNTPQPTQTPGGATATPVATSCPIQFSDVQPGDTFYPYVRCLACRGILGGYTDGTFRVGENVTRGQLSKIVSLAAGFAEVHTDQSFEDVAVGSTFYQFVERMASRGIIGGYDCGGPGEQCGANNLPYFRPFANATRGQISKIVSIAAGYGDDPGAQLFEDVIPSSTYFDFVQRLANRGIMGGYACGGVGEQCGANNLPYFRPGANATRGQTSKIVSNTWFPNCQTP